jgi:cytoskeletal protein RodZ
MPSANVGPTLRRAREDRGLSLGDVAARTNIPPRVPARLESNAFDELPGGLIVRGYLRAVASEVGLDSEPLIRESDAHAPSVDILDQLRARFLAGDRMQRVQRRASLLQLVCVIVCVACLFYALATHEVANTASADSPIESSIPFVDAS